MEAAAPESLVGAADRRGHHRRARAQRERCHARLAGDELALAAEGALGEDPDDATLFEGAERALDGARIRAREVYRDRPDAAVEGGVQRARMIHARHHDERDGAWDRDPEHD